MYIDQNDYSSVLEEPEVFLEPDTLESRNAPVRACYRYIKNRSHQLDYKAALAQDLPIGSGEIESAHRYIIQQRLKLPGAWWTTDNVDSMLALRIIRANNKWWILESTATSRLSLNRTFNHTRGKVCVSHSAFSR